MDLTHQAFSGFLPDGNGTCQTDRQSLHSQRKSRRMPLPPGSAMKGGRRVLWFHLWIFCAWISMLAYGCAVGPDFVRPKPPAVSRYTQGKQPTETVSADGQAQVFEYGANITEDYWRMFKSPPLNAMIREAIEENPGLQSAQARLRQSQENLRAGYGVFFPQIGGSFDATRQKFSPQKFGSSSPSNIFNLFTASATISYVLDVFGGQRRTIESLSAQVDQQNYTTQAAYLTLTGNIVNAAIAQAAYRAEIEASEQIISFEKELVELTETQAQAGTVPYVNVLSLKSQLLATEATLPTLKKNLDQSLHLLAALLGRASGEWLPPPLTLEDFALPANLPITLPSELVRRRPDILASEAQVHTASANVGVATAAMFPSFTLSGELGQNSSDITRLFDSAGTIWTVGTNMASPLFQGGTLWFQRRAAIEAYQASLSDYRQVVINALQQVADTLRGVEHDAETLRAQSEALVIAEENLNLVKANYEAGLVNYLQMLTADNQYQQAKLGYIQAKALRLQDTAALFVALGGGWWNAEAKPAGE